MKTLGHGIGGVALAMVLALGVAACGSRTAPPPEPGTSRGVPPDLRGRTVMLYPTQQLMGVPDAMDDELLFHLRSRASDVTWIPPNEIDDALERSPSLQARSRGLAVGQFLTAEVLRIGDPLFGEIYRASTLVGGEAALLPVRAELVRDSDDPLPRVRLTMALVEVRSGRIAWFAILDGDPHPIDDPRLLASAADEVSQTLLWYAGS
ncbi:MAG: hypothetical protein WEA34_15200 [Gemmatimonadota bacterium]